jgi:hypothetical protein
MASANQRPSGGLERFFAAIFDRLPPSLRAIKDRGNYGE